MHVQLCTYADSLRMYCFVHPHRYEAAVLQQSCEATVWTHMKYLGPLTVGGARRLANGALVGLWPADLQAILEFLLVVVCSDLSSRWKCAPELQNI